MSEDLVSPLLKAFRGLSKAAPAFLLLIIPKCSLCLAAYLNLFSMVGISLSPYHSWVTPALSVLIGIHIVTAWFKARKIADYRAFTLLVTGITFLITGKIILFLPAISWMGIGVMLVSNVLQIALSDKVCNRDLISFRSKIQSKSHFFVNYFQ